MKKGIALVLSALLIGVIFIVLVESTGAVYLHPGSPNDTSVTQGTTITFDNVNLTIRGAERIPVDYLQFTIITAGGILITHVKFYLNGTEFEDPDGKFSVTTITDVTDLPNSSGGSSFGFNEYC